MSQQDELDPQFVACFAALKSIIEILIGTETATPKQVAHLFRGQANNCQPDQALVAVILRSLAAFAEDPERANARRLLNEPPHGTA